MNFLIEKNSLHMKINEYLVRFSLEFRIIPFKLRSLKKILTSLYFEQLYELGNMLKTLESPTNLFKKTLMKAHFNPSIFHQVQSLSMKN